MKKWIFTAVAVIAVGAAIVLLLPKKGEVIEVPPPLVEVAEISTHTVSRSVDLIGYVAPMRQTAAVSRAYGKVTRINVTEGSRVYKDQVLLTLQPEEVGLTFKPQPVKAPIAGVVAEVMVREGEPVMQGTPVVAIIDPSLIEVEVAVAGEYYNDVQTSDAAFLMVNSDTIPARIKSKTPVVDPMTRTFNLTLTPQGSSPHLVSGLSVTVRLVLEEKEQVLAVPNSALQDSKLIVTQGDTVEQRKVTLGLRGAALTEITGGVTKGEMIIIFGGQNLATGQRVRTIVK
jgi:multidrug efflux pump subunit AcrA (membrane-fusion protein)